MNCKHQLPIIENELHYCLNTEVIFYSGNPVATQEYCESCLPCNGEAEQRKAPPAGILNALIHEHEYNTEHREANKLKKQELAANFLNSLRRAIKSGLKVCSKQEIMMRYNLCLQCKHYSPLSEQCTICGCQVNSCQALECVNKLAIAAEECPRPDEEGGPAWPRLA